MAFNNSPGRSEYTATAAQTLFPFNFKVYNDSDIKVYLTPSGGIPDDAVDILLLTTDYTVSINGDLGGTMTLVVASSVGDSITIVRELAIDRLIEYQTSGDLLASTLNIDQDYQTYLIADQQAQNNRYIQLPESSQGVDTTLPAPSPLELLGWDSNGTAIVNYTVADDGVFVNILNINAVADLASINITLYSTVNVRGYYTANDGGGGIFNYDATQSAVNNGGTIINGWIRQYSGAVNVKWYGAKGDGTTDDTTAIQNSFNDSLELEITEGSYLLSTTISIGSNRYINNNGTFLRDITVPTFDMFLIDGKSDITFSGGKIDGVQLEVVATVANRFCGIRVYDSVGGLSPTNVNIIGVEVTRTTSGEEQVEGIRAAIMFEDGINCKAENCYVHGNRSAGIRVDGLLSEDCKIINNTIVGILNDIGSTIGTLRGKRVSVLDNTISDSAYTAISLNTDDSIVSRNTVLNTSPGYAGIILGHDNTYTTASRTICSNNLIQDTGIGGTAAGAIIISNSDEVIISNNIIDNCTDYGIRFLGVPLTVGTGNCTVSDNKIVNCAGQGVLIGWGVGHSINENDMFNNGGGGVYVDGTKVTASNPITDIHIKGNNLKENGTLAAQSGITVIGSVTSEVRAYVTGNDFIGAATNLQAQGINVSVAGGVVEVQANMFNSFYTEATAYVIGTGGVFVYKDMKGVGELQRLTARVLFDGTTGTIISSYNVTSITGTAGAYTLVFDNDPNDIGYTVVGNASNTADDGLLANLKTIVMTTSQFTFEFRDNAGALAARNRVSLHIFGGRD